jgi:hypothetical protein
MFPDSDDVGAQAGQPRDYFYGMPDSCHFFIQTLNTSSASHNYNYQQLFISIK